VFEKSFLTPFKGFDPTFATEWSKAIDQAKTLSKLHTLYGILENSISWEKSSESLVRVEFVEIAICNMQSNFF